MKIVSHTYRRIGCTFFFHRERIEYVIIVQKNLERAGDADENMGKRGDDHDKF